MTTLRQFCLALLVLPLCAVAGESTIHFNIPAQSMAEALRLFANQAGMQLIYKPESVGQATSNAVVGEFGSRTALERLLKDKGFEIVFVGDNAATIRPVQQSDSASESASSASSSPDDSAEREPALTEVVVTAQKREERLQEVPVPVTVLSGSTLADRNQLRIKDYFSSVPSLNISPARPQYQTLSIRGISTGVLSNPTVGITVDDTPYGSSSDLGGAAGIPDIDPFDLARIEVLRGPKGALYGASSMGGMLKFVTVDPSSAGFSGRLQADTNAVRNGDGVGFGLRGAMNVPLGETSAARLSGFTRQDPGYIDNSVTGREGVNQTEAYGGRASVLWQPSDAFSLKLGALWQKLSSDGHPDSLRLPGFGDLQQDYPAGMGENELGVQVYSANINARLGSAELVSITGYNINSIIDSVDYSSVLGALSLPIFGTSSNKLTLDNDTKKLSQELRVIVPVNDKIRWSIGGFYTDEKSTYVQRLLAVTPLSGQPVGQSFALDFPVTYREAAVLSDVLFSITERFDVQIGGRQSRIKQTKNQTQTVFFGSQTPFALPEESNEADAFTYLLTPRFKISRDLMVYARVASGYRAGGSNPNPDHPQYDPDKTDNYELGVKGNLFERMLLFDLSVYHINWSDVQINLVDPVTHLSYNANGGRARSRGVELSAEFRPRRGMTLSGWVARGNAVLTEPLPANSTAYGADGAQLPLSTKLTWSISAEQEFALWAGAIGYVSGTAGFVDDRQGNFKGSAAVPRVDLTSYTRTDLRAGVRVDAWTVGVFANNISDTRGVLAGGDVAPSYAYTYIQPRTIGLSFSKVF